MDLVLSTLIGFVAFEHLGFLILEMFLWTKETGKRVFSNTKQKAEETRALAANMGLYNGFLSAGLIWGLFYPDPTISKEILSFFLLCVIVAGIYGAISVKRSIFFIQGLPACISLVLLLTL